jgi:hypothetical protein
MRVISHEQNAIPSIPASPTLAGGIVVGVMSCSSFLSEFNLMTTCRVEEWCARTRDKLNCVFE